MRQCAAIYDAVSCGRRQHLSDSTFFNYCSTSGTPSTPCVWVKRHQWRHCCSLRASPASGGRCPTAASCCTSRLAAPRSVFVLLPVDHTAVCEPCNQCDSAHQKRQWFLSSETQHQIMSRMNRGKLPTSRSMPGRLSSCANASAAYMSSTPASRSMSLVSTEADVIEHAEVRRNWALSSSNDHVVCRADVGPRHFPVGT